MKIYPTPLQGAMIIDTEPFRDERGKFARFFCMNELAEFLENRTIVQINYSNTVHKGTLRGFHFQYPPKAEAKLVRCLRGSIFDVIVDIRKNSPTFLEWCGEILSEKNMKMLFIPEGFAHGFQTLEEDCEMLYLHTEFYSPDHEGGIRFDDPKIGAEWQLEISEISKKDQAYTLLTPDFTGITV